jgi:hypothetical protein
VARSPYVIVIAIRHTVVHAATPITDCSLRSRRPPCHLNLSLDLYHHCAVLLFLLLVFAFITSHLTGGSSRERLTHTRSTLSSRCFTKFSGIFLWSETSTRTFYQSASAFTSFSFLRYCTLHCSQRLKGLGCDPHQGLGQTPRRLDRVSGSTFFCLWRSSSKYQYCQQVHHGSSPFLNNPFFENSPHAFFFWFIDGILASCPSFAFLP